MLLQGASSLKSPCRSKRDPFSHCSSRLGGIITSPNSDKEPTEVSGSKAMFAQDRDKTGVLSQCLAKIVSLVASAIFLSDFGMGAPKQANQTPDSQSLWKLSPKEDFSRDEPCSFSEVSEQPSSEGRNGRLHEPPEHQDRVSFGQLEIHIRHFMQPQQEQSQGRTRGPPRFFLSEALSMVERGITCT